MSFAQTIIDSRAIAEEKSVRQLREDLRQNGVPSRRDLSALRHLREVYAELPGETFGKILQQERSKT